MTDRRLYSRLYWDALDDPKFAEVYWDDATLALWVRLLVAGDAAWPTPVYVPATADQDAFRRLVETGLVDERPGGRYVIHGLDSEREKRAESARAAGLASGRSRASATSDERKANGRSTGVPREPRASANERATRNRGIEAEGIEVQPANERAFAVDDDDYLDAWYRLTVKAPTSKVTSWLDRLAADYGAQSLIVALSLASQDDFDPSTLISRTENRLWESAHANDRAALKARRDRAASAQAAPQMTDEQKAANLARLREMLAEQGLLPGASS